MHQCHRFSTCLAMLALAALAPLSATAACTRPILVPVAPIGQSVMIRAGQVSGAVPDLLKLVGARAGCTFVFAPMPRIRLETMFEMGKADLLVSATHSARRDRYGLFIALVETRATLISLDSMAAPPRSIDDLLARRELRVALVRGFDYGDAYLRLSQKLAEQGRLYLEPDPLTVARLLHGGMADVTIMPPSAVAGAVMGDARLAAMVARMRITPLAELPWIRSGIYISYASMHAGDRATLERALTASSKAGDMLAIFKRYYPPALLSESTRPL
ncbi:MAG: transporter substrate-binding domain-containing protein [Pseudomonadota bacterium]|nr:transporter substrate-binding domain-containing protein [Pseudomonadota bacterium]